jgi:hypothetical protein
MTTSLQPMTLGEILDRTFQIYRSRIAPTLLYYDQRIRHEGFDIEWMMHAAGMNAPVLAEARVVPVAGVESLEQPA